MMIFGNILGKAKPSGCASFTSVLQLSDCCRWQRPSVKATRVRGSFQARNCGITLRMTDRAHQMWGQVIMPGDVVVDATCGNGNDTVQLTQMVGPTGTVHCFDIQDAALTATKDRLSSIREELCVVNMHLCCHSRLGEVVPPVTASVIAFNLGYLPGADHNIVTCAETTAAAVRAASLVLRQGGLITVVAYIGHPGGLEEHKAVRDLLLQLPSDKWLSGEEVFLNRIAAPRLLYAFKGAEPR